ncbi:MAG: leucine-rich repeat protein [Eubacterium sp.]
MTKYEGTDAKVEIPTAIDGRAVNEIGDSAFSECRNLDEITVSKTVNKIGNGVFYIILPNGELKHIDVYYGGNKIDWVRMTQNTDLYTCTMHYAEKTAVDDYVFSITEDNEIDILRYVGTASEIAIPDFANGLKITRISRLMSSKIKK